MPLTPILGFPLSTAAAPGAQAAMSQRSRGQHLPGTTPAQTITFPPIITPAITSGLSSDHKAPAVSRIKQESTTNRAAPRAVQRGTALPARVLTAAAPVTFPILAAATVTTDPAINTTSFSLAAGVPPDTPAARLTLVPAATAITGPRTWHHPTWFATHTPDPDPERHRLKNQPTRGELVAAGSAR